ncbi:MAG: Ig-like domain-containing protein, partial [Lachnospiraceae bacterium]|nr:Ig-like domain-containing protein [Lachnospiraceae bacterium]
FYYTYRGKKYYYTENLLRCNTDNAYLTISGNRVTAKQSAQDFVPSEETRNTNKFEVRCGGVYNAGTQGKFFTTPYINDLCCTSVELYPAGTTSLELKNPGSDVLINGTKRNLQPGETEKINTSALPANACQKYFTYKSSNTKVVTVDTLGRVTAVGNGKATVTVTAGDGSGKTAKVDYTVARVANSIVVSTKTGTDKVIPGKTLNMTATVLPADTVDKKVTWAFDDGTLDNAYAKINDKTGLLTAKKTGNVTVVATNAASGVTGNKEITIIAATDKFKCTDESIEKNGVTVYTKSEGTLSKTAEFSVKVFSATAGEYAQPPSVTSSNTAFFTVAPSGPPSNDLANHNTKTYKYKVTAVSAKTCSGTVNIAATDGSNKKLSVKVKVLVPVDSIEITTPGNANTVTDGKSLKLTAKTNADASNKKIKWGFENETSAAGLGVDTDAFKNTGTFKVKQNSAVKGSVRVFATAEDGSNYRESLVIYVRKQGLTDVKIKEGSETAKNTTLWTHYDDRDLVYKKEFTVDVASTNAGSEDDYQPDLTVTSSNEQIAKAKYDSGKLTVYTYNEDEHYCAPKTGQCTITLKAKDGSNKSATLTVKTAEPVREIYLSADKTSRDIAANGRITMKAAVNSSATNKKVDWSLKDGSGNALDSSIAKISPSGAISPNTQLAAKTKIRAVATAADGSGKEVFEEITLYPAQGIITCKDGDTVIPAKGLEMNAGGYRDITITGNAGAFADYLVTYTAGAVKVQYRQKSAAGTIIRITALKKGNSSIKAAARDASNKSATFRVTVK